jgi:hypothetical protein
MPMLTKREAREELKKLVENFTGEITRHREDSRVTFVCCLCPARRHLSMAYARQFSTTVQQVAAGKCASKSDSLQ